MVLPFRYACGTLRARRPDFQSADKAPIVQSQSALKPASQEFSMRAPDTSAPAILIKIGIALWAVALVWWFLYYAPWAGAFDLMDLKIPCITWAIPECAGAQEMFLKKSGIPTYRPLLWWTGTAVVIIGFYQRRQGRK
jgi:hypothetical protein